MLRVDCPDESTGKKISDLRLNLNLEVKDLTDSFLVRLLKGDEERNSVTSD